jgi:lysozyme family protein
MTPNFDTSLAFVWRPEFDSPHQGTHTTEGDSGGATSGGVIQATWDAAMRAGVVKGSLPDAGPDQLSAVLRATCWGTICDKLPAGLDLLYFNGSMMTGRFPKLFQEALGFMGPDDVDGWIGPDSLERARSRDPETLIDAISGAHAAYLATLESWPRFGRGWTTRLKAAQLAAIALADGTPIV